MTLWAISDLHVAAAGNLEAVARIPASPTDDLIVAGDVCEDIKLFELCMGLLASRFRKVIWAPGNHELWYWRGNGPKRALDRYDALVEICRRYEIGTPKDDSIEVCHNGLDVSVVPIFTLYDGGFAQEPDQPAMELADKSLIDPYPYLSIGALCHALVGQAQLQLQRLPLNLPRVFVSHFPLTAICAREPGFDWLAATSGSPLTERWIEDYRPAVVVFGHQHRPRSRIRNGVRYEEVSLGYPRDWRTADGIESYLRDVTPSARMVVC